MKKGFGVLLALVAAPSLAAENFLAMARASLPANFTTTPIVVDGHVDEAWAAAPSVAFTHPFNPEMTGLPTHCPIKAEARAMWDGALLYLLVNVEDAQVNTGAAQIPDKDGVEFWVDHFNDKVRKFQEDDGTFTISAPPMSFVANRAQNRIYDNVTSRYLKSYASALRDDGKGYVVEIAWQLGERARKKLTSFGFDFGINDADATGKRQCRLFWGPAREPRTTNDSHGWGTVWLMEPTSPMQPDTFMLEQNLAKADAQVRGIWRDERALDRAIAIARSARGGKDQKTIDRANLKLDQALRGLRRSGPFPDPQDLRAVRHLPDPFTFLNGKRVKTLADWNRRRAEIKSLMQYYEFGAMPAKPASLTATAATGNSRDITIRMTEGARSATFAPRLTLPTPEQAAAAGRQAPFPVIVSLDFALNDGNPVYLAAGYAVLSIPARQVHSDNVEHTGPLFDLYPYDVKAGHDFGSLLGWAWGASRSVDALEYLLRTDASFTVTVDGRAVPLVAMDKLAITGFSRMGKAALLTGMLDERFAVTHPGASGSGGAAPYRFVPFGTQYAWGYTDGSETLGDHMRHQTHNSNEMMRRFLNDTVPAAVQPRMYLTRTQGYGERLPYDHHLEIAAIAPRAVLVASTNDDYGNNAEGDAIGVQGARPVFEWLGAGDRLALDLYMGGGGHSLKLPQQHNFVRFLDHVLYGVPLPATAPPGDATHTPTSVQLRRDPYLTGGEDGRSIYDIYRLSRKTGLDAMMPWRSHLPRRPETP
jgi:endo-1,4-beta-xylanase